MPQADVPFPNMITHRSCESTTFRTSSAPELFPVAGELFRVPVEQLTAIG